MTLQITESETKILLECLIRQDGDLLRICGGSQDEDAVADAGNDLVELRLLLNRIRDEAVARFGKRVLELGREPL
jgi:hypothetical protein